MGKLTISQNRLGILAVLMLLWATSAFANAQNDDFEIDFADSTSKTAEVEAVSQTKDTANLDDVSFDKNENVAKEEDGVVIISPGAASPEDSLAAFGIESPFDTHRARPEIGSPESNSYGAEEGTGEAIELSRPETTDFTEDLSLEASDGREVQGGSEAYSRVERAGAVLTEAELRVDGTILREKNNLNFITLGKTVYLKMVEGRQVYPGTEYVVFKEEGLVQPDAEQLVLGMKIDTRGVLRIIRVDSEWVMARAILVYGLIEPGDKIRLRDPERQRYLTSLRGDRNRLPADMEGKVASIQGPKRMAVRNDIIYLDFGRTVGTVPGLRFSVYRDVDNNELASFKKIGPVGRIGLVEVISTRLKTSTARVLNMGTPVLIGDRIRYR